MDFLPRFYRLSFVAVLYNMMIPLAGLCDTAFLGHLKDIKPLAGVILASILFDYLYRILKFLRTSTNALTAQAVGEDNNQEMILAGLRSSLIAIAIALIILLLQYPIHKLGFTILSGSPAIEVSGIEYFNARIWGAPAVLLNFVLIGWFLGREKNSLVLLISIVANLSNVLFDYLMIYRWHWESMGAGLATALSQYLGLLVALIGVTFSLNWQDVSLAITKVWKKESLQDAIGLNFNILVRFLALISVYSIFTNISATMGTNLLAENGLLLQIALLSQFAIQGVGMTTQTLVGNFKGKGEEHKILSLLIVAISTSLIISLGFALSVIYFPETIFSWLTNHAEINQEIVSYSIWLLPLFSFTAIAFMLEAYFIGLKEGKILRNASLIAFFLIFIPLIILTLYIQSVHLLWFSLTSYMLTLIVVLTIQIWKFTHQFETIITN
ncbi:MAG: guanitoxin biosynthesis MATE family efflux transporter GntT [Waterburya sp.]